MSRKRPNMKRTRSWMLTASLIMAVLAFNMSFLQHH